MALQRALGASPWEPAPLCTAGQWGTRAGFPAACGYLCPGNGHAVVPGLAACWHAGSAHLSRLDLFLGLQSSCAFGSLDVPRGSHG